MSMDGEIQMSFHKTEEGDINIDACLRLGPVSICDIAVIFLELANAFELEEDEVDYLIEVFKDYRDRGCAIDRERILMDLRALEELKGKLPNPNASDGNGQAIPKPELSSVDSGDSSHGTDE